MANVCSCYMEITGPKDQIQELGTKIKNQDPGLVGVVRKSGEELSSNPLFSWFGESNNRRCYGLVQDPEEITFEDRFIGLDFDCAWAPPQTELENLSRAYPDCEFSVRYEEPGCENYGNLTYSKGALIMEQIMEQEEYLNNYDTEYNEIVGNIEDKDYDLFLKDVSKMDGLDDDSETCRYPHLVEKHYLKRLRDEDLPLIIGHKWFSSTNQKTYEERVKGIPV